MKIFISDFTGLCNRLESLAFAYAIREHFGHEIVLDWPELDSFSVVHTQRGKMRPWHRFGGIKLRDCDPATFQTLGRYRNIGLRGLAGAPPDEMVRSAQRVAADLRLKPHLAESVKALFLPAQKSGRNVMGVHLRRGDFDGANAPLYDGTRRGCAVPDWWFRWAMEQVRAQRPETIFYVAGTGDPKALPWLAGFDCLFLREASPYTYKGEIHASAGDPVAELFALACCPALLATPSSSYSHWAANILGLPSKIFLPPPMTREDSPALAQLDVHYRLMPEWMLATRDAPSSVPARLADESAWVKPPETGWIIAERSVLTERTVLRMD